MSGLRERLRAVGHENVSAEHTSTLELTSDDFLTLAGDCIIGIEADRVPADFDEEFVAACQDADATIRIELEAAGHTAVVTARGDPDLSFESERSAVVRTSEYVDDDRTIAVEATAAAADLDRDLVEALADGAALTATLTVT
ncbi:DUF371 domain-containing protein [Halovenus sp. WSH3]|uniref:DUF371 domain-containing protein n=1 Tax=Halovenus carboxidivorans TaxID=2692199 RepID=A0A6B0TFW8_9EURY|nr:DUF371 domain-containing protein [Halovenus carboxidivorans]MXR52079.1 DUF371 domain-containing protein [Halovenus carboxidivorans]